jgi:hypothetical protein
MATSYQEIQNTTPANFNRWDVPVKMGILIGLIGIVLSTVGFMFILPSSYIGYLVFTGITFVISIGLYFYTGVRQRQAMGGFISIRDAFAAIFIAILISSIISTIWGLIYARIIDPELTEKIKDGTLAMMERMKAPPEKLDETAKQIDEQIGSSVKPGVLLLSFAKSLVVSSIIGLVCALIVKREPKQLMR